MYIRMTKLEKIITTFSFFENPNSHYNSKKDKIC